MDLNRYLTFSFDIFDTLIKRKVANPHDVFFLVEEELDKKFCRKTDFARLRLEAKKKAESVSRFYCIGDIYNIIELDESLKSIAEQIEKNIEVDISYPNKQTVSLFNSIKITEKQIFLISDMYLDKETIGRILDKNEINGYAHLYISQEEKSEKLGGGLYKKVLQENRIKSKSHIHVGDNIKSDIISAKISGLHTLLIKNRYAGNYDSTRGLLDTDVQDYAFVRSNIAAEIEIIEDEWMKIGYGCLGPILWGFSNWLAQNLTNKGISRVYFLAREGEILKNAFKILYPDQFECHYLYVSRRALTVPSFISASFDEIVARISFPKSITVVEFLNYIGIESQNVQADIKQAGLSEEDSISGWHIAEDSRIRLLYKLIQQKAETVFAKQHDCVMKYFKQEGLKGIVAIVDVGWNCTMQSAIERLIKNEEATIEGFYFGVNERNKLSGGSTARGFIYEPGRNINYQYYIMGMSGPLELMTTAHHGTTLGYIESDNKIIPILDESEYFGSVCRPEGDAIDKMQDGALRFVRQMAEIPYLKHRIISGSAAFQNFYLFGKRPIAKHREMFYGMKEYDSKVELTMLDPDAKGINGEHSLINGFWNSSWKIGYMADKFLLPLPYHEIYRLLRKKK